LSRPVQGIIGPTILGGFISNMRLYLISISIMIFITLEDHIDWPILHTAKACREELRPGSLFEAIQPIL